MDKQESLLRPSVFEYRDANKFFRDYFRYQKSKNPQFTTRAMARSLSMNSHSLISHFIAGTRIIRPHHLDKITTKFKFSDDEVRYFEAIVFRGSAKSKREQDFYESILDRVKPENEQKKISFDEFKLISHWVHMAILSMTQLKDFQEDPAWIRSRLFFPIPISEISEAIERLLSCGLLERKNEKLVKTHRGLTTNGVGKSDAIRSHHKQILELATQAIEDQDVKERILNSCAITISKEKLPEVQKLIENFRECISACAEASPGDETYELSVQFFKLTKQGWK